MKVKSALLGLAAVGGGLLMSATVASADGYSAPRAYVPVSSWTGCYVGIQGGWAGGHSDHKTLQPYPAIVGLGHTEFSLARFDMEGYAIGYTTGCNLQTGSIVVGIETDTSWTNKQGSSFDILTPPPLVAGTTFSSATREQWLSTTRLRLGHAWGPVLLYGTIGAAFADAEITVCGPPSLTTCSSQDKWRIGFVTGAGIEWAVMHGWSAKVEYLHIDFMNQQYFAPPPTVGGVAFQNRAGGVYLQDDIVRVGLNYKFGDRREAPLK